MINSTTLPIILRASSETIKNASKLPWPQKPELFKEKECNYIEYKESEIRLIWTEGDEFFTLSLPYEIMFTQFSKDMTELLDQLNGFTKKDNINDEGKVSVFIKNGRYWLGEAKEGDMFGTLHPARITASEEELDEFDLTGVEHAPGSLIFIAKNTPIGYEDDVLRGYYCFLSSKDILRYSTSFWVIEQQMFKFLTLDEVIQQGGFL